MVPGHTFFKAEIKKLKFETDAGTKFPGTALIKFQVDGREKPVVELMGYLGEKEIYNAIDRGEVLNLDHCYIEKFSLRDYRLTRNMGASRSRNRDGWAGRPSRDTLQPPPPPPASPPLASISAWNPANETACWTRLARK